MRRTSMLIVMAALGGLVACTGDMDGEAEAVDVPDRTPPATATPRADNPVATPRFEAVDGGHVTGLVRLYDERGEAMAAAESALPGFFLEVVLDGLSEGEHAWHIHEGTCDEIGSVVVPMTSIGDRAGIAAPLVMPGDGAIRGGARVTDLELQDVLDGGYVLVVHASAGSDFGPPAACADLAGDDNATF